MPVLIPPESLEPIRRQGRVADEIIANASTLFASSPVAKIAYEKRPRNKDKIKARIIP